MSLHGDQRAASEIGAVLLEDLNHVSADVAGAHVIEPQLDDAGQSGAGLEKQFGEIEVLREHHRVMFACPKHDVRVGGIGRAKFAPVPGSMPVLPEKGDPGNRKAVVNDDGHAG